MPANAVDTCGARLSPESWPKLRVPPAVGVPPSPLGELKPATTKDTTRHKEAFAAIAR